MKSFGNVFSLTGTVPAMTVESIYCWRVSQSGATRPGHRRKGRLAPKTPTHHGCLFHNSDKRRRTWVLNRFDLLHLSRFTQYQRMVSNLAQCEFSMGKTLMVYDMNLREMENYEKIYKNIGMTLLGAAFHSSLNTWILFNFCEVALKKNILFTLQNKTSHLHMRRLQNAKRKYRGQKEYGKIAKVRIYSDIFSVQTVADNQFNDWSVSKKNAGSCCKIRLISESNQV